MGTVSIPVNRTSSKSACVYLGSATSFNVKTFIQNSGDSSVRKINYQQLTNNNFVIEGSANASRAFTYSYDSQYMNVSVSGNGGPTKSYNASTGILSANIHTTGTATQGGTVNATGNVKAYLLIPE